MGAIPRSDLPGHRHLHERAALALDRCQEEPDVDFNESGDWESLRWGMTHAALGMGNLRDGGVLIVGVSERGGAWVRTGISDDQLRTFDPDLVASHLNSYISPHVDIDVVAVRHTDGNQYLAIYVREFALIPLVCKKNGPNGSGITEGRVYVRLPAPARTSVVTNAQQMHDLIELAAEKRARGILETGRRVGLVPSQQAPSEFDDELKGL
jgi:hypothetical protein